MKAFSVVAVAVGLLLSGCSAPVGPMTHYSGNAVIESHRKSSKKCIVAVKLANGEKTEHKWGSRSSCGNIQDGVTVQIVDGQFKK